MKSGKGKSHKSGESTNLSFEEKKELALAIHDNQGLALMIGNIQGAPLAFTVINLEEGVDPSVTGFPDEHFDMVAVAGTLEKQPRKKVLDCIHEWRRILKPAAQLDIMVPNLRWACLAIMRGRLNDDWPGILATFYGTQESEGEFHKTAFTLQMLRALLETAGFVMREATLMPWEIVHGEDIVQAEHVYLKAVKVGA